MYLFMKIQLISKVKIQFHVIYIKHEYQKTMERCFKFSKLFNIHQTVAAK